MKRIMLVEDQGGVREGLADFLSLQGYQVDTFDSAGRALEFLEAGARPDLILLDLVLRPDMNGWQFSELVKDHPDFRQIPIVAVSGAHLDREQIAQCRAEAFLLKPFELDALLAVLRRLLDGDGDAEPLPS